MRLASGVEIIHDVRRRSRDTRIVVFTGFSCTGLIATVVESGVDARHTAALSEPMFADDAVSRGIDFKVVVRAVGPFSWTRAAGHFYALAIAATAPPDRSFPWPTHLIHQLRQTRVTSA